MKLGAFSVSLSVKDLAVSKAFYEKLGFEVMAGEADKRYYILRNGEHLIGIFEGMFEGNLLTFNPGWDQRGQPVEGEWTDARAVYEQLRAEGVETLSDITAGAESGPASFMLRDPDGNVILVDQHR